MPDQTSTSAPEDAAVANPTFNYTDDAFKSRFSLQQIDAILKPFSESCEESSKYQAKREAELKELRQLPSKLVHRYFCELFFMV